MITTSTLIFLALAFFLIATLYSSVGFGGGSSYLAILALYLKDALLMKTTGLLCNLVVVSSGSFLFAKKGLLNWRKCIPIITSGLLAAFLGSLIVLKQGAFFISLGAVLILSGLLLFIQFFNKREDRAPVAGTPLWMDVFTGAVIGFLSGLVGIGGGILLSPVLNLLRWDSPKKIAALASFFILVNSAAGLLGQLISGHFKADIAFAGVLLAAVFLGGQLGTRISLRILRPSLIKGLTGLLVLYIGAKLVLQYTTGIRI